MINLLLLLTACSSDPAPAAETPASTPATTNKSADPASDDAPTMASGTSSTLIQVDVCGNNRAMTLYPRIAGYDPTDDAFLLSQGQVGFIKADAEVNVELLRVYGWVGEWQDGSGLVWFDQPSDLSPNEVHDNFKDEYHCEGLGGDGLVTSVDGNATVVIVRDERFKTTSGVGPGASTDDARSWLCASDCTEQEMMIGPELLITSDVASAAISGGKIWELTVPIGPVTQASTERTRGGKAGKGGKSGKSGARGKAGR